jgi:dephospho-CoA kinase
MEEIGQRDPKAIAIVEAALILEAGAAPRFDRLIVVTCHREQRILRYARRLGISEDAARAEVTRRMAAQIPDEEKIKVADFVIDNSGSLDATEQQVQRVFAALRLSNKQQS